MGKGAMGEMAEGEEKKGLRREDRGVRKNRGTRRYTRPRREGRQKVGDLERRKEREREREKEEGREKLLEYLEASSIRGSVSAV